MSSPAPRAGATMLGWLAALAVAATGCDRPRRDASAPASAEIWLAGDVHLGGVPVSPDDVRARLAPLAAWTAGAVGVVNLEGPAIAMADAPPDRLANHPAGLAGLRAAGVVVAGIANNHALDGGEDAPGRTAAALRAAGLIPAGLDAGPAIVERGGLRIVIGAHTVDEPGLAARDEPDLGARLDAERRAGDVLVVTLHVLAPPSYLPGPRVVAAVERAVRAGAAVVAVHGSHAIARVERRGSTVIFWGLGNLLFTCDCTDETDALLARVTLTRAGAGEAKVVPIAAGLGSAAARPSSEPALVFDLLATLRSSPLTRAAAGDHARL